MFISIKKNIKDKIVYRSRSKISKTVGFKRNASG